MDLSYTAGEIAFRDELGRFFRSAIPVEIRRKVSEGRALAREDYVTSQKILHANGLATPNWPVQWGGKDWSPVQRYIFEEECGFAGTPPLIPFGLSMCGPVILRFGTPEQKKRFLPRQRAALAYLSPDIGGDGAAEEPAELVAEGNLPGGIAEVHQATPSLSSRSALASSLPAALFGRLSRISSAAGSSCLPRRSARKPRSCSSVKARTPGLSAT